MRILISIPGIPRNQSLSSLTGGSGGESNKFHGHDFLVNSTERDGDIWFVLEGPHGLRETREINSGTVVFLGAETSYPPNYFYDRSGAEAFMKQFDLIHTPHDFYGPNVRRDYPFLSWWINSNHGSVFDGTDRDYTWLRSAGIPEKTRDLSVICSATSFTPFHRMRLRFVEALKDHFGSRLDWFGNGIRPIKEKWDGLAPYRYTVAIENQVFPRLITEKLQDPFLTWTFPFYAGAPDAGAVFGEEAFESLDIRDPNAAIGKIESSIAQGMWEKRLEALGNARSIVLDDFHLLKRIEKIAVRATTQDNLGKKIRTVWAKDWFVGESTVRFDQLLARKIGNRLLDWVEGSNRTQAR